MADPNRKINLNLPSDDEEENDSDEPESDLDPTEISLVKEFEDEFKSRFTDDDTTFAEFCKQKPKPPPIVFPFDAFHHNHRGGGNRGGGGGGRYQNYGGHRNNFDNRRNNYDGQRYNNNYDRNRDNQQHFKRAREDSNQPGGN